MNQQFVPSRLRIEKKKIMHIKRRLVNAKGQIKVSVGQEVCPQDVIAEGHSSSGFRTIHLSKELRVSPSRALSLLTRQVGQNIYQGELLAMKRDLWGLSKHLVLSPVDGIVETYDTKSGNVKIQLAPKTIRLVSGVYGIVDEVNESSGIVVIRTMVNAIYGVMGSGKEREGLLKILGPSDMLASSKQIPSQAQGRILVAGGLTFMSALERAIDVRIGGIITGGINAGDYRSMAGGQWNIWHKHWSDVGLSLMVTEGFGSAPIGEDIFSLLREYNESFVILDGNRSRLILPINEQDSMIYIRKTALPVKFEVESFPQMGLSPLKEGIKVRIIASPYLGLQGVVEGVDQTLTKLPSGLETYLVTVASGAQKVRVPLLNLEVLGYFYEQSSFLRK